MTFAYLTQPASVAPVGPTWQAYSDRNSLFEGDGSHSSARGSYLAACVFLERIFGVSAVGNNYQPAGVSGAPALQQAAHQAVKARNWDWPQPGGPPCSQCIL